GWAVLGYDVIGGNLTVFQLFDQQGNIPFGVVPLFMLDVWEHAYYLDYLNVRADYIKAVWNIANWSNVAARLTAATTKTEGLLVLS
uniref:superoxide dismutase n=1 Tax=Herbiconiux sp. YIM B11900 TaxID=3404131 RepID=UPI003F8300F7